MSAISDALTSYFTLIESFGATAHQRLRPPATETELTRLEEFIGVDLPQEVRDWYSVHNGPDRSHPETNSTSATLFPILIPVSVDEVLDVIHWYTDYTDQIDPSYTHATRTGIPILKTPGDEAMLLADCSGQSPRFVTWSGGEGYLDTAGYYHHSLVDFIDGIRHHGEADFLEAEDGGVFVKRNVSVEVATLYHDPTGAQRLHYGFRLDDQPVPRIVNS